MPRLTVGAERKAQGYTLRRSDELEFQLIWDQRNGCATLFRGRYGTPRSLAGIVEFDVSVPDKVRAAERWVLAWPDRPED
ncbi:hypothetical protein [Roseicella sp. DB1501]|uniref:hypothetical protein n=1 Tax=Roseicella sp. DB1501 TaxID=2730925 RepID=UPI00149205E2|nr:hypothetical protein [Roseicella sp. DB1501]NOG73751.1 hypothetical protein [Roseicella sp. DB1501]